MKLSKVFILFIASSFLVTCAVWAQSARNDKREAAMQRLGAVQISKHKSTGAARFLKLEPGSGARLGLAPAATAEQRRHESISFFRNFGEAVGVSDAGSLQFVSEKRDAQGKTHLTWKQFHGKVPVYAGTIKTHFDSLNQLYAVNGTAIPDIDVNPNPRISSKRAASTARKIVVSERGNGKDLKIGSKTLYIYREGLARGVEGNNHLAWEIEVTNLASVRDLVYVDAHTGKFIEKINGIQDDLFRRAYDGHNLNKVPNNYPNGPYWVEGDPFPTASQEANNMILASEETYNFFDSAFGRDSFDGEGGIMDQIFNRGYQCPNASWNGTFISFCPGFTTDDVTAHEWGHAYTQYLNNLIYAWQPGALNESYSDIWGETVDRINNRGTDTPDPARTAGECSSFSPPVGTLRVNSPVGIAGDYFAQSAQFGPPLTTTGITDDVVAALDASNTTGPSTLDGCTTILNASEVAGKIALINRGTCTFVVKVLNAQAAGALGVIIQNNVSAGLPGMGGVNPTITIPSLGVQQSTGESIRANLGVGVVTTLLAEPGSDVSYRWLMGEDVTGGGALRDMFNPTCYSNPAKVTDTAFYHCAATDNGGVHLNSGIPNHAFALLVDGGTFNGITVSSIGLTKAAHIYFRAADVYHVEDSDFEDHADALELSCSDLIGDPLNALTGGPSGETISVADCAEVTDAINAVELRTEPTFCNFGTLLAQSPPAFCASNTTTGVPTSIESFDFETDPTNFWTISRSGTTPSFVDRNWEWVNLADVAGTGSGFFAPAPNIGVCSADDDQTGVLNLTSPIINLPQTTNFARATFDHWVGTEANFDGGNLKISVNGGPFQLIPPSQFTFNSYNLVLLPPDQNTSPLAGQPAWSGTDPGSANKGSWGRTHVNLAGFARPGDSIQLRWDLGTDCGTGATGWYIDNVNIFSCVPNIPQISIADLDITEGDAGTSIANFVVLLSARTITNVAVNFQVIDGTAKKGQDFEQNPGGTIVIPAGALGVFLPVSIKGDTKVEGDEFFTIQLSNPVNATLGSDTTAQGNIANDD